jgi:DMSO/TMAO reductase YedYZ molybdopterin-dependent catalytic subunit
VLAACGSGSGSGSGSGGSAGSGSANSALQSDGAKLLSQMAAYASTAASCKSATTPVVCLEHADVTLGNQVHAYANMLAVGKGFSAPQNDVVSTRNSAQTLANSLEILGDAQPTQANYDQVLNTFDLNGAIAQLRGDVQKLDRSLGG